MANNLVAITCVIKCESPEKVRAIEQIAREKVALDNVLVSVASAFPGGAEMQRIRHFRLGDHFDDIQVLDSEPSDPASFRLVFRVRKDADRFWRDLLARVLDSIKKSADGVSVTSIAK
jgi:hypothetical protein